MPATLPKKILIVDDDPSILLTLKHLLKVPGVEVLACDVIEQAEEALNNSHFDLVISDIRMSGVDSIEGLELLNFVKQRYDTKVIIMTGLGSAEIEEEAYRLGAYHFFNKPIDINSLMLKVSALGIPVRS